MFSTILVIISLFAITLNADLIDINKPSVDSELDAAYWEGLAKTELFESYHRDNINNKAKNVIIFVGGGMGVSTITPARILKGQNMKMTGEETKLIFEGFPDTCLLKTYSVDSQVTDSSAAATALLYGIKTNNGVSGVSARIKKGVSKCEDVSNNIIHSIFDFANEAGKRTGFITTTRITEATAAGTYSSIADINWEGSIPSKFSQHPTASECKDIARQLIEEHPGMIFNVIMGGGGRYLYPVNYTDPASGKPGMRSDGRNMVEKWKQLKKDSGIAADRYKFVNNKDELTQATAKKDIDYLFGIFNENHMNFDKERDEKLQPALEEMVASAIQVLKDKGKGFLLVVENGLIDLAHHENYANMALYETLALERAVRRALTMVSIEDTLVIVTADHSQALTMNGYQPRGHNIMGLAGFDDEAHTPYTTLMYSNGPGYMANRSDPSKVDTSALRYRTHAAVFVESSHHTGEDVALYSIGPMSHLFHGTKESTYVAFAVHFASCIGAYSTHEHCSEPVQPGTRSYTSSAIAVPIVAMYSYMFMVIALFLTVFI